MAISAGVGAAEATGDFNAILWRRTLEIRRSAKLLWLYELRNSKVGHASEFSKIANLATLSGPLFSNSIRRAVWEQQISSLFTRSGKGSASFRCFSAILSDWLDQSQRTQFN